MPDEYTEVTHSCRDIVDAFDFIKVSVQAFWADIGGDVLEVFAAPGLLDGRFADIGSENLHGKSDAGFLQILQQLDGNRISLFSRRASWHPDPYHPAFRSI